MRGAGWTRYRPRYTPARFGCALFSTSLRTCRLITEDDAESRLSADLWVINSCTVKSPSQSQMATAINEAKSHGIPLVVAGCVPQGDKKSKDLEVSIFSIDSCRVPQNAITHRVSRSTPTNHLAHI